MAGHRTTRDPGAHGLLATGPSPCEGCGQLTAMTDAWAIRGLCPDCRAGQYGASERHERARLFEPAPQPMPGQVAFFDE